MFPLLFLVLFMFFTISSLSSFCNLKLCFSVVFLSINIPIAPISKNALTVMFSYISTFFIPILSHISLNILNVLLTSLQLFSFFTMLFGAPTYILLYYIFTSMGYTTFPQFHYGFFCSILYSRHRIFFLFYSITFSPIASLLSHSMHCILVIFSLLSFSFLQFQASWQGSHHILLICLRGRNPCSQFSQFQTSQLSHPPYSTYVATVFSVIYPLLSRSAPSGSMLYLSQYSYAFFHIEHTSLLICYAFCDIVICTASPLFHLFQSSSIIRYSYLQYPNSLHLKHLTSSFVSCYLITFSSSPHCIILLVSISNLFWEFGFFPLPSESCSYGPGA